MQAGTRHCSRDVMRQLPFVCQLVVLTQQCHVGKLSYQDSAPDLLPELAQCEIPQTIMGLQELCSILVGAHDSVLSTPRDHGAVAASS